MSTVVYILSSFPVISETFIVREIHELKRKGFDVIILVQKGSVGHISGSVIHADAEALMKDVHYYSELRSKVSRLQLLLYHLFFLILNPTRYLKVLRLSIASSKKTFRLFLRSVLFALKIRRSRGVHIHAHFALDACEQAMLISILTGVPYSFTVHAHDIFIPDLLKLEEEKFSNAKFVACISQHNKDFILTKYPAVDPNKLKIIHCGVDPSELTFIKKKRRRKSTIIAVGRLVEHKGFKYLIDACRLLYERDGLDFVCKIIGDGVDRTELEKLILTYDLTQVVLLLGPMEQSAVFESIRSSDLFVLPSVVDARGSMDGIPVALMEAMAMQIPVVSTRLSGIPELVKDGAGILVEQKDSEALALAIQHIITLPDSQRQQMGTIGRDIITEEYNLQKEVAKLAEYFRNQNDTAS